MTAQPPSNPSPPPPPPSPSGPSGPQSRRFDPKAPLPTSLPRKLRGGIKLDPKTSIGSLAWAGTRWMRLVEECAGNAAVSEGLVYARAGQTRTFTFLAGGISGRVQGRLPGAYAIEIRLPTFNHEQWEAAIGATVNEARFMASILAGELPAGVEDLFAPLHLRLFPSGAADLAVSCSCGKAASQSLAYMKATGAALPPNTAPPEVPDSPWCKHVCCVMALMAERISRDPFIIFQLRGLGKDDLLERLRQRRAVVGAAKSAGGGRPVPAYAPRIPGVGEDPSSPIEHALADFWRLGPELRELDLSMDRPPASHVLLRRLGSSPFEGGKFPLVGLLATCYDVLSDAARATAAEETPLLPPEDAEEES